MTCHVVGRVIKTFLSKIRKAEMKTVKEKKELCTCFWDQSLTQPHGARRGVFWPLWSKLRGFCCCCCCFLHNWVRNSVPFWLTSSSSFSLSFTSCSKFPSTVSWVCCRAECQCGFLLVQFFFLPWLQFVRK